MYMLDKIEHKNIFLNGTVTMKVTGKILKVNIRCNEIPKSAKVTAFTEDGELILETYIYKTNQSFYPLNRIVDVIEVETEPQEQIIEEGNIKFIGSVESPPFTIEEEVFCDYFYSHGVLIFQIEGLEQGERLDLLTTHFERDREVL